jgi:hypothetical protein
LKLMSALSSFVVGWSAGVTAEINSKCKHTFQLYRAQRGFGLSGL